MGLRWVCDGVAMGGERREGLCDVAWMHPLLRYQGSAGAETRKSALTGHVVVFGSWEHMVGSFWVARVKGSRQRWGRECVSGSGGTRGSFRGWRSQDVLIVLIT